SLFGTLLRRAPFGPGVLRRLPLVGSPPVLERLVIACPVGSGDRSRSKVLAGSGLLASSKNRYAASLLQFTMVAPEPREVQGRRLRSRLTSTDGPKRQSSAARLRSRWRREVHPADDRRASRERVQRRSQCRTAPSAAGRLASR